MNILVFTLCSNITQLQTLMSIVINDCPIITWLIVLVIYYLLIIIPLEVIHTRLDTFDDFSLKQACDSSDLQQ